MISQGFKANLIIHRTYIVFKGLISWSSLRAPKLLETALSYTLMTECNNRVVVCLKVHQKVMVLWSWRLEGKGFDKRNFG